MGRIDLNSNWLMRHEALSWGPEMSPAVLDRIDGWIETDLPCDVHMPLIRDGVIKDPVEADFSYACEWTEKKSWWFKKEFHLDESVALESVVELVLESLDVEADVFLNGYHLTHHRSAHYPFTSIVNEYVRAGSNVLLVRVTSGLERYSDSDVAMVNGAVGTEKNAGRGDRGDDRRVFVRKAQYVYGWHWGPRVPTCGIVGDAWIDIHSLNTIRWVHAHTESLAQDAAVSFQVEIERFHAYLTADARVHLEVSDGVSTVLELAQDVVLRSGTNYVDLKGVIRDVRPWWPNGMGEPFLYTVKVWMESSVGRSVYPEFRFGVRTIRVNQDALGKGDRLFAIEINGVRAFCKGANWIPADSIRLLQP